MQPGSSKYSGCNGLPKKDGITYLLAANTTSQELFEKFVKTRTPVAFNDQISDAKCSLNGQNLWSDSYLKQKAGACEIKVETREENGTYGKGQEIHTTFAEFIDTRKEGRTYLTTQDLVYDEDGRPAIISPPLTALTEDYPLTPSLFNNLVISNINIWFGYTKEYSTSGLHHDFHDNLYVLLRGEKRITLISPAEAHNLYTVGEISHIHANGRINYSGQLPTRSDGSDVGAEAALKAAERLQAVAARLAHKEQQHKQLDDQQQGEQGEEGNNSDIEDELDRALDDVLDAEMADGDGDDYSNSESGADAAEEDDEYAYGWDDADESESEKGACFGANSDGEHNSSSEGSDEEAGAISQESGSCSDSEASNSNSGHSNGSGSSEGSPRNSDSDNESAESVRNKVRTVKRRVKRDALTADILGKGLIAALAASKRRRTEDNTTTTATTTATSTAAAVVDATDVAKTSGKSQCNKSTKKAAAEKSAPAHDSSAGAVKSLPANFSRVNTDLPYDALQREFPLYTQLLERGGAVDVVLKAGQMLYIPAGWFHEVRSRGAEPVVVDEKSSTLYNGSVCDGMKHGAGSCSTVGTGVMGAGSMVSNGSATGGESGEYGGHLALNFWFHPPDNDVYDKPYKSDFWRKDFEARMKDSK